jgi:AraC family transcriptional activator of tynA and feaB
MAVVFSTNDVHPRDSVAYWLDDVLGGSVRYTLNSNTKPYRASARLGNVGDLVIVDHQCDPHGVERGARDIERATCDGLMLMLQLGGRLVHCQDGRQAVMEPGGFLLLDPRRPHTAQYPEQSRVVMMRMPRQSIEARLGNALPHICRTLSSQGPITSLAFGYLKMIADRMDAIDESAATTITAQALDLLALALSAESASAVSLSSPRAVALTMLKVEIESRLHEPQLKPALAAAAAGISVRYANALLAEEDQCLERYIIDRRLERCRRVFDDPTQAHRTIGEIAFSWGFADLSHFTRRFKAKFGCTPGDYRKNTQPGVTL